MNSRLAACLLAFLLLPSLAAAQSAEYLGMRIGVDNVYLRSEPVGPDAFIRSAIVGDTTFAGQTWLIYQGCSTASRELLCATPASQTRSYMRFAFSQVMGYTVQTSYRSADGKTVDSTQGIVFARDTVYAERRDSVRISYLAQCQVDALNFRDCLRILRYTDSTKNDFLYGKGIGLLRSESQRPGSRGDTLRYTQTIISTQGAARLSPRVRLTPELRARIHEVDGRIRPRHALAPAPKF